MQTELSAPTTGNLPGRRRFVGFLVCGVMTGLAGALGLHYWDNFHAVLPGLVYRSAQLDASGLEARITRYHFRTIINLRGENLDADWYQDERELARRYGIRHFDLPIDSVASPTPDELRQLTSILKSDDALPVLIHCQSGVNRTGILAAICVLLLDESGSLAKARAQLHWQYGNLPWADSTKSSLAFLDRYEHWLTENHLHHSPATFCRWTECGQR
jgi:protein tyrosine phosphatase (PTP) superfamily phosphohydrolase (DUF442 family)